MIMPVVAVNVRCHNNLESVKGFCRFQSDLVYLLRRSTAIRFKGLHILFEEHTCRFTVSKLGCINSWYDDSGTQF